MKRWANYSLQSGRILQVYSLPDDAPPFVLEGTEVIEIPEGSIEAVRDLRVVDGLVVVQPLPPQPNQDFDFDPVLDAWVMNVVRARERLKQEIEQARDVHAFSSTILYDGKNLDADAVSIDRLSKKLAALDSYEKIGQTMPAPMLVWRDADNITHVFATHDEYKQWLAGFAVALDLRGTQAFAVSWQKKSELELLTTPEELLAFIPTT